MDSMPPHAPAIPPAARDAIRRAIAHRARAIRDAEDAARAAWADPSLNRWARLAERERVAADRALVAAILATGPEGEHDDPIDRLPARAVILGGTAWLVVPDPARVEDDGGGDSEPLMLLSVADLGLVVLDLDTGAEDDAAPVAAMAPPADALTAEERSLLGHVRALGIADARQRLFLAGRYQATYDRLARGEGPAEDATDALIRRTVERLGTNAVAELRAIVEGDDVGGIVERAHAVLDAVWLVDAEKALAGGEPDDDDLFTIGQVVQAARLARSILNEVPEPRARRAAG